MEPSDEDLERLLVKGRPAPRPDFVAGLERSLRPNRPRVRRSPARIALAGMTLAGGLAAAAAVAAAVGVLPTSINHSHDATAEPRCRQVIVERRVRQAYFVRDRAGDIHVRYRFVTEPRPVKRCR